ncbi:MAG: hypothetical protein AB7I59_02740 [Geminicoccaceae bacterium]
MSRMPYFRTTSRLVTGLVALLALAEPTLADTAAPAPDPHRPTCAARDEIKDVLEQRYAERQAALGLSQDGRLLEVFTAADGLTWTMLVTSTDGVSCVIASGRSWRQHTPPIPGLDAGWNP